MTVANQITILRILMVPAFIVLVLYYVHEGGEGLRYAALGLFGLAAHVPVLILASLLTPAQDPARVEAYVNPPAVGH